MNNPHYWCTWRTQNMLSRLRQTEKASPLLFAGDQGAKLARCVLHEEALFGENGMAYQFEEFRHKLIFLLDDGWDVSHDTHPDRDRHLFSSLILDAQRFPSFTGEPWERLQKLNAEIRRLGWRGLGLWVACQNFGERQEGPPASDRAVHAFWAERFAWCRKAGIAYIKVDWGARCGDAAYRDIMTQEAHRCAPGLVIEHAFPCRPMNDVFATNRFSFWQPVQDTFETVARKSDVFRIYDTAPQLCIPTTIDRCARMLQALPSHSQTLLNCEDAPYIATGLGLCIGAMRPSMGLSEGERRDPFHTFGRILELQRALAWFDLAPAFANADADAGISCREETLTDEWHFHEDDFWWSDLNGKSVVQKAPSVCARNTALPDIAPQERERPYVLSCGYPNGMTAVSFLPRISIAGPFMPPCDAVIRAKGAVGVFGTFRRLTVHTRIAENSRILFRDLAACREYDITKEVRLSDDAYTLSWETIRRHSVSRAGDESDTGCVLRVVSGSAV